jgi:tRNA (guanine26-N2/guanine27-N2)-dimethyltransferase
MLSQVKTPVECGMFGTRERMLGMLTVISEELDEFPFSYSLPHLAQVLHCTSIPTTTFCSAMLHAGFRVSLTHTAATCVKTDAPPSAIWDVMRSWVKKNPISAKRLEGDTPATRILAKESSFEATFDMHPLADPPSRKIKLVRFQDNPPDWGPKARANKA